MLKIFKVHGEMSVRVNVCISKIMRTAMKIGLYTYPKYANCGNLCFGMPFS